VFSDENRRRYDMVGKLAPLERELKTYQRHKEKLLAKAEGKYVLIKNSQVVGVFDTDGAALREGARRFGNVPFLVKKIVRVEVPLDFSSNIFGA
jgi:hypothetical protein